MLLVAVAFVPMLASRPGVVTDDTKTYLYLDPGRYLRQAVSLWDPHVALGTVTHENIGYLLPMGPFYWVLAEAHVPLWIAQRLWMGALLWAAGAGVLALCRTINLSGVGRYVAAFGFMYTPYVLQYSGRISVILLPWAGLPWLLTFVMLALRNSRSWRYPALFALVVMVVSGINASSILYVGIAPALWLPYSVLVSKEATWRQAWATAWRIALLTFLASLWWAIGLQVEAAYGINVLKYTETVPATSAASTPTEILRGLGYWYFYGNDRVGSWTQSSVAYTQNLWLLAASFAVPTLSLVAAAFTRWRYRTYFIFIAVVGMVLAVGPNPYDSPTTVGSLLKAIMVDTTAGLAMRSTDRASPVVILSLALFLGAGVSSLRLRRYWLGWLAAGVALLAVVAASEPLWSGSIIADGFNQPAKPPAYVRQAAAALNTSHPGTRVYALPGNNFAAYRWGDTIDTVYPGLMTRPFVTHEQQIMGSLPTADTLEAIDGPLQDGVTDWSTLAPMSALLSAGDVLVQYDQAYERYDAPNPQVVAAGLAKTPPGLSNPLHYGKPVPNVPVIAHFGETSLALGQPDNWPTPLVTYTVDDPRPIVRTESLSTPLVVDGDASGIVDAAAVGLLAHNPTILYAGTLDTDPSARRRTASHPATLVVTDTNRKQGYRWNSLNENTGYTETAGQAPNTADPSDAPLNLFPGAPSNAQTTTSFRGITSVTASSYGSSITYLPEDRPAAALDGNAQTAWLTNPFVPQGGQWWQVNLLHPATPGSIRLLQPQTGDPNRYITSVRLTFNNGTSVTEHLSAASRTPPGQVVPLPGVTFSTLRITIVSTAVTDPALPVGSLSSTGFAEVTIPGVSAHETVTMPEDLLRSFGVRSLFDRLTLVMTRLRSSGFPPRNDPEPALARQFWLPTARTFSVVGQARISPLVADDAIDRLLGRPGSNFDGLVAYSSGRLPGDLAVGAINTVDGNPNTIWEPGMGAGHQAGEVLHYNLVKPVTFDHLDLNVVADGRHSVPTVITVATEHGSRRLNLPPLADANAAGATVGVPLTFPSLTGEHLTITFDAVRLEYTTDYYSQSPNALPIAIAEVGIPGVEASPLPGTVPSTCRGDLVTIDGQPLWLQVSGSTNAALARQALAVTLCGPDAGGLHLGPGHHALASTPGSTTGLDIDRLAFDSAPGGGSETTANNLLVPPTVAPSPVVRIEHQNATSYRLAVQGFPGRPAGNELVLGQSLNRGWTATAVGANGQRVALGAPMLIDAFANGWNLENPKLAPLVENGTLQVELRWTPQSRVNIALVISILTALVCLVLAFGFRRRRKTRSLDDGRMADEGLLWSVRPSGGSPASWPVTVTGAVAVALVGGAISSWTTGLVAGAFTLVVLRYPVRAILLGAGSAICMAAAGAVVVIQQAHFAFLANGNWPGSFPAASTLAWSAVVLLGANGLVAVLTDRPGSDRISDDPGLLPPAPPEPPVPSPTR